MLNPVQNLQQQIRGVETRLSTLEERVSTITACAPDPSLVSRTEVALALGVSRQRVHQWTQIAGSPEPKAKIPYALYALGEWQDWYKTRGLDCAKARREKNGVLS